MGCNSSRAIHYANSSEKVPVSIIKPESKTFEKDKPSILKQLEEKSQKEKGNLVQSRNKQEKTAAATPIKSDQLKQQPQKFKIKLERSDGKDQGIINLDKKKSDKLADVHELLPVIRTKTKSAMDVIIKSSKKERKDISQKLLETENNKSRIQQQLKQQDQRIKVDQTVTRGPVKAFKTRIIGKGKNTVNDDESEKTAIKLKKRQFNEESQTKMDQLKKLFDHSREMEFIHQNFKSQIPLYTTNTTFKVRTPQRVESFLEKSEDESQVQSLQSNRRLNSQNLNESMFPVLNNISSAQSLNQKIFASNNSDHNQKKRLSQASKKLTSKSNSVRENSSSSLFQEIKINIKRDSDPPMINIFDPLNIHVDSEPEIQENTQELQVPIEKPKIKITQTDLNELKISYNSNNFDSLVTTRQRFKSYDDQNTLHPLRSSSHNDGDSARSMSVKDYGKLEPNRSAGNTKSVVSLHKIRQKRIHEEIKKINSSMTSMKNFKYETYQTFNPKALLITQKSNNLHPLALQNEFSFMMRGGTKLTPKDNGVDMFSFGNKEKESFMSKSITVQNYSSKQELSLQQSLRHSKESRGSKSSRVRNFLPKKSQFHKSYASIQSRPNLNVSNYEFDSEAVNGNLKNPPSEQFFLTVGDQNHTQSQQQISIVITEQDQIDNKDFLQPIDIRSSFQSNLSNLLNVNNPKNRSEKKKDDFLLDSTLLNLSDRNNYTQYSGSRKGSDMRSDHANSQVDSKQAMIGGDSILSQGDGQDQDCNEQNENENLLIYLTESDGSYVEERLPQHSKSFKQQFEQQQKQPYSNQTLQNSSKKQALQGSSNSVVYKNFKNSSSDMMAKSLLSGTISRKATSQMRIVQFKSSNQTISKGSSANLMPSYISRIYQKEDEDFYREKPSRLKVIEERNSVAYLQLRFPEPSLDH